MVKWIIKNITIEINIESMCDYEDGGGFLHGNQTHLYRVYSFRSAVKRLKKCLKDFQLLKSRSGATPPEMNYHYGDVDYVEPYADKPEEIECISKDIPLNAIIWRCTDPDYIEHVKNGKKFECRNDCSKCSSGHKIDLRVPRDIIEGDIALKIQ